MTSDAESYLKKLEEIQNGTTTQDTIFNQTPDEEKFIINADTREISVPSSFASIGVIYDHNAETIFFKIPRYFDNVDLNEHTCIIQYINAGKEEDIYTVTQKDLSNNGEILFGWKITNSVTKYSGSVSFAVRFYSITNGVFDYNFNTKVAQFNVLNGLNVTANNININPDLLSQWIEKINALDNIELPMRTSDLINDSNFLSIETDPTVPKWAKQPEKPTYTAQEVGAVDKSGGAISETIVDTLETISSEFPVPVTGESTKTFLGKIRKFMLDFNAFKTGIITVGKLVNHDQCTEPGFALDARYAGNMSNRIEKIWGTVMELGNNMAKFPTPEEVLIKTGDISNTYIRTRESSGEKYPVPGTDENTDVFTGKILTFLRNVKPLESDVTYYVATTGSDIIGDGTQEKPFKTIQYTVNKIPKDLNGNVVTINIADGNYDEVVKIFGLHGGALNIKSLSNPDTLNNLCKVKKISVVYCEAMIQFYGIYLTQTNDIAFNSVACSYIYITACQAIESALNSYGFEFIYAKVRMRGCKSLNHSACATAYYSSLSSENWTTDSSGITHGMVASTSGQIIMTGTQPNGGVKQFYQLDGGQFIRENGTQITNVTNSGLACTWGTIQSGYFRHGNENAATITVQVSITTTASLTAGTTYSITGFPKNSTGNAIAVNCHQEGLKDWCQINGGDGTLFFTPKVAIASGKTLHFNCTYLTTI